jgi:purine-binding chemotaxis protein CheW
MKEAAPPSDDGRKRGAEILKARALQAAKPIHAVSSSGNALSIVEFRLAGERYAVEQQFVLEVHPLDALTPLPCTPAFLAGVISIRGQLLPVIDIKKFFELPEQGITDIHAVVVVQSGDMTLGLLADTIVAARTIDADTIQPSLPTLTGIRAQYLRGIAADHLVVLDIRKIIADPKLIINDEAGAAS